MSTRDSIQAAYQALVRESKPITRRALAELANCDVRTISKHKDIWNPNAVVAVSVVLEKPSALASFDDSIDLRLQRIAEFDASPADYR